MLKLAVFDFDSTLMDGETIDFFAEELGIGEEVARITEEAMSGRLDFFESLQQRVGLLKGLDYTVVEKIAHNLPYMPGARETIAELKNRGMKVVCFSGGFRTATSYAKDILGYDADFSNALHVKNGKLTGLVGGDMMFNFSKGDMLVRLQNILGINEEETLVCGDGANDLSMFAHAGTRIAFCARDILKREANIIIETKDLTQILKEIQC
ncbi:phosphoserine phosphatase SerB [Sulfurimonas sediminis]|uniref:Phosphoserine phosphatase n=2 Tax=Sulfurimonas sediminis TaxID=2590020 RepID=A0A7M1B3Y1_9BACT|nr:phosphoserine phosphatase SerB [Sulfurimonas sediminis]